MKSELRFKFNRDKCLEIIKKNTEEDSSFNIDALLKSKNFYGSFYDDYTFSITPTRKYRGAYIPKIEGAMFEINDEELKTLIKTKTSSSIFPYIVSGIAILLPTIGFGIFGFIGGLILGIIMLALTASNSKSGVLELIDLIEDEY